MLVSTTNTGSGPRRSVISKSHADVATDLLDLPAKKKRTYTTDLYKAGTFVIIISLYTALCMLYMAGWNMIFITLALILLFAVF